MTKILFVLHKKPDAVPGGTELHTLDMVKGLLHRRFRIYLVFPGPSGLVLRDYNKKTVSEESYETGSLRPEELKNEAAERIFQKILKKFSIDIVHFQHLYGLPISFIEVAKNHGCKTAVTFHDYFYWCLNYNLLNLNSKGAFFCFFERDDDKCCKCLKSMQYIVPQDYNLQRRKYIAELFKYQDIFIFPTVYVRDIFLATYSVIQSNRCYVIEHGIRKDFFTINGFQQSKSQPPPRNSMPLSGNALALADYKGNQEASINLAFLGNFTLEKGNYYFREIARHLLGDDRFRFYVVGNVNMSFPNKETDNLRFLGGYNREILNKILIKNKINLITLLSPWPEVYSYTLSEAICSNVPVIATDLGALRERVSKYGIGPLVPYENPVPRMVQILKDIADNLEILDYFKKRCVLASKEIPDIETMITKYEKIFRF